MKQLEVATLLFPHRRKSILSAIHMDNSFFLKQLQTDEYDDRFPLSSKTFSLKFQLNFESQLARSSHNGKLLAVVNKNNYLLTTCADHNNSCITPLIHYILYLVFLFYMYVTLYQMLCFLMHFSSCILFTSWHPHYSMVFSFLHVVSILLQMCVNIGLTNSSSNPAWYSCDFSFPNNHT